MDATCQRVALGESYHGVAVGDIFIDTNFASFINKGVRKPVGPKLSGYDALTLLIMQREMS